MKTSQKAKWSKQKREIFALNCVKGDVKLTKSVVLKAFEVRDVQGNMRVWGALMMSLYNYRASRQFLLKKCDHMATKDLPRSRV